MNDFPTKCSPILLLTLAPWFGCSESTSPEAESVTSAPASGDGEEANPTGTDESTGTNSTAGASGSTQPSGPNTSEGSGAGGNQSGPPQGGELLTTGTIDDLETFTKSFCSDRCPLAGDGKCMDGGPDSEIGPCFFGTDCTDCGTRGVEIPLIPGGKAASGADTFGVQEGDPVEDFTTYDSNGDLISLSNFCGKWIYIEFGTMGCSGCKRNAPVLEEMARALGDEHHGLQVMTLMAMNVTPLEPNHTRVAMPHELQTWVSEYNQEKVIVGGDPEWAIYRRFWPFEGDQKPRTPRAVLIDPNCNFYSDWQYDEERLRSLMESWGG